MASPSEKSTTRLAMFKVHDVKRQQARRYPLREKPLVRSTRTGKSVAWCAQLVWRSSKSGRAKCSGLEDVVGGLSERNCPNRLGSGSGGTHEGRPAPQVGSL